MDFVLETGVQLLVRYCQARTKLIVSASEITGLLLQIPCDVLKLRVDDIGQLILQLFKLLAQKLNALIDLFLRVALPVCNFLALFSQLLIHRSVIGLQFVGLEVTLSVQICSVLLVLVQSCIDMLDLSIVLYEVVLLLIKLFDNLLLVVLELLVIGCEVFINFLKLLFHSFLDIKSPLLQFLHLILQDFYMIFSLFGSLPQERLVEAKVIEIVELREANQPSLGELILRIVWDRRILLVCFLCL